MSGYLDTYTESHALLVGIDDYEHPVFQPLGNAQLDATDLADLLAGKPYYFYTHLLLGSDATRQAVLDALYDLRNVDENSRVIFYFAGHGYNIPDRFGHETGYLACTETIPQRDFTALELEEVMDLRRFSAAKHIAFIFDSCFSGQALGMTRLRSAADRFIERRAYQVLSAGAGDQAVSDRRSMTRLLLHALDPECTSDCLRFNAVGLYVQEQMALDTKNTQIPQFGHIEGSQGGDLVFYEPPEVQPIDLLPARLRRGLTHGDPDTRYFAIERAEKLLDDPQYGSNIRAVLDSMHTDDPHREVRRRAYEALHPPPPDTSMPLAIGAKRPAVDVTTPHDDEEPSPAPRAKQKSKTRWPLIIGLGLGGLAAVICGMVGLGLIFPGLWSTAPQVALSTDTPPRPTDTPVPSITPIPTLSDAERDQLALSGAVESNAEWTPVIDDMDGVEMVLVPAGCFPMGSTEEEIDYVMELCIALMGIDECHRWWYDNEMPQHEVCLTQAFWIDRYEVTNEQYLPGEVGADINYPVDRVVWTEAAVYCQDRGARLPTEAEWEYASRGPDGLMYPWGNLFDGNLTNYCDVTCEKEWPDPAFDDGYNHTAPVDAFPENISWVGAYNMSGNVWEWVSDWYAMNYYWTLADGVANPQGPDLGSQHLQRGGSWASAPYLVHSAMRYVPEDYTTAYGNGFRCARTYKPSTDMPIPTPVPTPLPTPTLTSVDVPEEIEMFAFDGVYENYEWEMYIDIVDGVPMALVPAGCFRMGSTEEDIDQAMQSCVEAFGEDSCDLYWFEDEIPQNIICFDDPFWIDVYEVTNEDFDYFGGEAELSSYWTDDDLPRERITWEEAAAFCELRGTRLPTEAEWIYAARGPDGWLYPWGNDFDGSLTNYCDAQCDYEWADPEFDDEYKYTAPVDSYLYGFSWVGAYNMSGNVWEWVNDWYAYDYYDYLWDFDANPQGPPDGDYRVMMGGSWRDIDVHVRVSNRVGLDPTYADDDIGFRCARSYR
ncbi:MAG: SUMF1/EgtB/PvdO family nonheme iron enzyme [Anaerolineae bacterium]|nr:SUMF1/EgtB/PvdO family nonheme iron enzyme [Anaerolineae bacterium]